MRNGTRLLAVDALVNLALGVALLLFPTGLARWLGLPQPSTPFYASILGAVLTGIGLALLLERYKPATGLTGLGLSGAIVINVCGAGALLVWLLVGQFELAARGYLLLWSVVVIVLGLAFRELLTELGRR